MTEKWSTQKIHILDGTDIELHPEVWSGLWFVIDVHGGEERGLSPALPLPLAKKRAVSEAQKLGRDKQ